MLTRQHLHVSDPAETTRMTAFEARFYTHQVEQAGLPCSWQTDPERFQLIANESAKVGQPVNRDEALYWIEIAKARALAAGEVIGWVKVEENTEALAPVGK